MLKIQMSMRNETQPGNGPIVRVYDATVLNRCEDGYEQWLGSYSVRVSSDERFFTVYSYMGQPIGTIVRPRYDERFQRWTASLVDGTYVGRKDGYLPGHPGPIQALRKLLIAAHSYLDVRETEGA